MSIFAKLFTMDTCHNEHIRHSGRITAVSGTHLYVEFAPAVADGCTSCSLVTHCPTPGSKDKRVQVRARMSAHMAGSPAGSMMPQPGDTVTIETPHATVTRATTLLLTIPSAVFVGVLAAALICDVAEAAAALCACCAGAVAMACVHLYSKRKPVWEITDIKRTAN